MVDIDVNTCHFLYLNINDHALEYMIKFMIYIITFTWIYDQIYDIYIITFTWIYDWIYDCIYDIYNYIHLNILLNIWYL